MHTNRFDVKTARPIRTPFKTLHKFAIDANGFVRMLCISKNLHGGGVAVNKQAFDWLTGGGIPGTPIDKMEIRLVNMVSNRAWEGTVEMFPRFPTWEEGEWGAYTIIDEDWDGWRDVVSAAETEARAQVSKPDDLAAAMTSDPFFDGWSQVRLPAAQKLVSENSKYYTMLTLVQDNPSYALVITKDGLTAWRKAT